LKVTSVMYARMMFDHINAERPPQLEAQREQLIRRLEAAHG